MTDTTVLHARWVVPVIPRGRVLANHSVVITDGRIAEILPTDAARSRYEGADSVDLPTHVLTPGFVNTHGHAAMTLLRGYADDRELMDWLNNHIWPVEGQVVDADFVYDGARLAAAEMISSGTTCAADTYFFPESTARAWIELQFRGQIAIPVIQFPNAWAAGEEDSFLKGLAFRDSIRNNPLMTTAFAPHAPYTVTDPGFEKAVMYAAELDLPIHLHLHETATEVTDGVNQDGVRPFARMHRLGVIANNLQAVHMTQLTDEEIGIAADCGIHVAHCPESNMKLASGTCRVQELLDAGVNVALGTDGAASNNNLDLIEEGRTAAFQSKLTRQDATSLSAEQVLDMMTINGARFLGLEDEIGSIETGKSADLVATDLSDLRSQPVHNPISQLVYTASGTQVSHTWIAGVPLYQDNQFTKLSLADLATATDDWRERIQSL